MWGHRRCSICGRQGHKVDMVKTGVTTPGGQELGPRSRVIWDHKDCVTPPKGNSEGQSFSESLLPKSGIHGPRCGPHKDVVFEGACPVCVGEDRAKLTRKVKALKEALKDTVDLQVKCIDAEKRAESLDLKYNEAQATINELLKINATASSEVSGYGQKIDEKIAMEAIDYRAKLRTMGKHALQIEAMRLDQAVRMLNHSLRLKEEAVTLREAEDTSKAPKDPDEMETALYEALEEISRLEGALKKQVNTSNDLYATGIEAMKERDRCKMAFKAASREIESMRGVQDKSKTAETEGGDRVGEE